MPTGHIRRRQASDGKMSYQIIVETDPDPITGKRQRKYFTHHGTMREANAILDRLKAEIASGGIAKPSALKLSDWMSEWMRLYLPNIAETTRAGYEERIKTRLTPYLGNYPLNTLRTASIQGWVNMLSQDEHLAPKTVKNVYLNLKAALDKAVVLNMLPSNPCTGVVLPKPVKYQAQVYNNTEIMQMLNAAQGTDIYLLVALDVLTGLRRGEIAALQWSDVDFENGVIHITRNRVIAGGKKITKAPKSQSGIRDISIGDKLLALLKEEYMRYCADKERLGMDFVDSNYVIRKKNGEAYSPDSLTQKWERFCDANELRHIRLHDLRHTCATAMLGAGVEPKVIQTRLGHSDISTTMNIYAHCLPSMNKDAGTKIDALL